MYREIVQNPEYANLHEETGRVIAALLGDRELETYIDQQRNKEGEVNMCKALEDLRKYERDIGIQQGMEQGMEQGLQQGRQNTLQLTRKLLLEDRTDDLMRATSDQSWDDHLCKEYGL